MKLLLLNKSEGVFWVLRSVKMAIITKILFLSLLNPLYAEKYYVSAQGNDDSPGNAIASPWRTLDRVNKQKFSPGDTIYFRCGDIFRGQLLINNSGDTEKQIVFTNYGKGSNPVFSGAVSLNSWKKYDEKISSSCFSQPILALYANNKLAITARYPNTGFLTIDEGLARIGLIDKSLTQNDGFWNGATIRIRSIDWVYEIRKVASYRKGEILFGKHEQYSVEQGYEYRYSGNENQTLYDVMAGYGFYLENKFSALDTLNEWFYNTDLKQLYFIGDTASVEAVVTDHGIIIGKAVHDIVFDGIDLEKYFKTGIYSSQNISSIRVCNNKISHITGSGIRMDGLAEKCIIADNVFEDLNARAISMMRPAYCDISGNSIKRIGLIRGYGISGVNGATAIAMPNIETKIQVPPYTNHNAVRNNTIDSCGYVGIRVDGYDNLIENNVVSNSMLTLNDGAGIYCYARQYNVTYNNIIRRNIVLNVYGDNMGTPGNSYIAKGIYLDNNTHENLVEGNTIINSRAAGILVNDASNRNKIIDNSLFSNAEGISFAEWQNIGQNYGNVITGNIIFCTSKTQKAVSLVNHLSEQMCVGTFDSNVYANLYEKYYFKILSNHNSFRTTNELGFEGWQTNVKGDLHSSSLQQSDFKNYKAEGEIFYNTGLLPKEIKLASNNYFYLNGNKAPENIMLSPFASIILIRKQEFSTYK
jgi:parallel beta-helix repeat protein